MKSSWRVWFLSSSWRTSQIIGYSWGGKVRYLKLLGSCWSWSLSSFFFFPYLSHIKQHLSRFYMAELTIYGVVTCRKMFHLATNLSWRRGTYNRRFYFLSLRRSNGQIQGFYYDPKSQPYQELNLRPQNACFLLTSSVDYTWFAPSVHSSPLLLYVPLSVVSSGI